MSTTKTRTLCDFVAIYNLDRRCVITTLRKWSNTTAILSSVFWRISCSLLILIWEVEFGSVFELFEYIHIKYKNQTGDARIKLNDNAENALLLLRRLSLCTSWLLSLNKADALDTPPLLVWKSHEQIYIYIQMQSIYAVKMNIVTSHFFPFSSQVVTPITNWDTGITNHEERG